MMKNKMGLAMIAGLLSGCTCDMVFHIPSLSIYFDTPIDAFSEYTFRIDGRLLCDQESIENEDEPYDVDECIRGGPLMTEDGNRVEGVGMTMEFLSADSLPIIITRNGTAIVDTVLDVDCKTEKQPFRSCGGPTSCVAELALDGEE